MSSMVRNTISAAILMLAIGHSPALAQETGELDGVEWDHARAALLASPTGDMALAIQRWKALLASDRLGFADYSGFLVAYPGFPDEAKLRAYAERALEREAVSPERIAAYFDRVPPLGNFARAQYALALFALNRPEANEVGLAAWRGGAMSDVSEAYLFPKLGPVLTYADHDARMDALLWQSNPMQAERLLRFTSPAAQPLFAARLSLVKGIDPLASGALLPDQARSDPGYVYNRLHWLRSTAQWGAASQLLVTRPPLAAPTAQPGRWVNDLLGVARRSDDASAVRIAASIDDAFAPGADISTMAYALRDDYTSLMWLGGTKALWSMGDGDRAAALFWRYGAAARTPQTRAKGFYWAGRAMLQAGQEAEAQRYFEMAAAYPDNYYGQLALERLGRPLPNLASIPQTVPSDQERAAFNARPLVKAVREVARETDWPTAVRFFRELAEQAESESDHVLVVDLARELGRRDLAVILGQAAHLDGHGIYRITSFPMIPVPQGADWTMVHAISRHESQFAQNAVSRVGARGLMQLMPGTAREQAGKLDREYLPQALTGDAGYNMLLGDAYFNRMLRYYNGAYPLAVAAYNAGPGRVNQWLAANGDPRKGGPDWVSWIERIPISETRNYVQRVLENAVVYDALRPAKASYTGPNPLSHFLGKTTPG
jgi:soluble lytic murein transglycosylase